VDDLKDLRLQKQLTRTALAARVGVSKTTIRVWEDGTSQPRPERIPRLAEALEVDANRLPSMLRAAAEEKRRCALTAPDLAR
jgi:transcriptional regulator with XRE-family HTH domain